MKNETLDFKHEIAALLSKPCGIDASALVEWIERPPDCAMGDYAFPCFRLSKTMRKAPPLIAKELYEALTPPDFISRLETAGAYINFFIKPEVYAKEVIDGVRAGGYGGSLEGENRRVIIDYSSINIAKPFHIGHLSSTVIGHSLYRIYKHFGFEPVGINHLGDWGTQFGKLITAYKKWGDKSAIERDSVRALLKLYVRYHEEAEADPALDDEARAWFKRIEDGDEEALALFDWFKELTLKEVGRVYELLGIEFDSYAGESFYNDKMGRVIDELKAKDLLKLDNGAYIVDLEPYGMPPSIILRSDGATLYATRDIAAALYRKDEYDFHKSLYVVAYQQNLHFRQLFKVIELMGYEWARDLEHVAFGMVSIPEGTLSTRGGNVVFLEDVLNAAIEKTLSIMEEKSPELEDKPAAARMVGVGAVVFAALYNNRIKDIAFSYEKALNFDGETGPYVQYTHARCCSVLRKKQTPVPDDIDCAALNDEHAMRVIRKLYAFKDAARDAMNKNEPYLISRAIVEIAQAYNKFYFERRIIGEAPPVEAARLALTRATRDVIALGLYLLGIESPERM